MSTRDRAVGARVALQLNDILLDIRKSFGMHGRTSWNVDHVDPDVITLRFYHWPTYVSVFYTATNVRNAMLNVLRDTVPCARFRAVFRKPDRSKDYRRVDLDFYPPGAPDLPSQFIVIEENVEPHRQHWRALLDRAAGSDAYFTRARRDRTT
jgi:hypothetical protein